MAVHLEREIKRLKRSILELSALVEENVLKAVRGVRDRDARVDEQITKSDREVDAMEVELEEDCLKVMALYQPVATDLRVIIAILKINNDLERIGDLAVNIAQRAHALAGLGEGEFQAVDFQDMDVKVRKMLQDSLRSLINLDEQMAQSVLRSDDEVDDINRSIYLQVRDLVRMQPDRTEALLSQLSVARNLERIADHATNIAEDVIYIAEGSIVRHGLKV